MSGDRLLQIILNPDFPSGHAELLRSDGSVLAAFDDGDDRAAFCALFEHDEAVALLLSPDLYRAFVANADRVMGGANETRH